MIRVACCVALGLVVAVVRDAWRRLRSGAAPVEVGFAPPARRPAPDVVTAAR
jgi:hypothetical protein